MNKEIDAEKILQTLAAIREAIPDELRRPPQAPETRSIAAFHGDSIADFELMTVAEAIEDVSSELSESVVRARAKALAAALRIYYEMEELARDPAHADLIPQVEAMRAAYERDFGVPIPPKS